MIHNPWIQASWDSKEPSSHILKPLVHCTYMVAGENTVFPLSSLHSYPTNHCSIAVVLVISASMTGEDRQIFCLCHLSIQKYVPNKIVNKICLVGMLKLIVLLPFLIATIFYTKQLKIFLYVTQESHKYLKCSTIKYREISILSWFIKIIEMKYVWIYIQNFPCNLYLSASIFAPLNGLLYIKNVNKWGIMSRYLLTYNVTFLDEE